VLAVYTAVMASSRNDCGAFDAAVETYRTEKSDLPEEDARRAATMDGADRANACTRSAIACKSPHPGSAIKWEPVLMKSVSGCVTNVGATGEKTNRL
jgi:hypothetical protein